LVSVADAPNHGDYWAFHLIMNGEATCVGFTSQERRDDVRTSRPGAAPCILPAPPTLIGRTLHRSIA
jgi:hypothetical protein